MEEVGLDRVKSIEMLKELQIEHKSIKNNPELLEIQKKVSRFKKKEENLRYKGQADSDQILELRQKFQNALNKLNSIDTRQVALKEAKDLIKSQTSLEGLKVYIGSLTELRKSKDASARELEVSLIGYLAEVYKENLIEEGNSLRLLVRLAEVIQSYFRDLNRNVHKAAAVALCDLYQYSLPKSSQQVVFSFMYDPLHSILTTGIDVQVQQAAALTLLVWIQHLSTENDQGNLILVYPKVISLFLKLRAEFADFLNAIGLLTEVCGFQLLIEQIGGFLNKVVFYLKHSSANSYPLKTAASQLLVHVGRHLIDIGYKIDPFPSEILTALRELRGEKVPNLQNKVREALKVWEIFRATLLEQPVEISPNPKPIKRIEPENHFRSIRTLLKMKKEKLKGKEEKKSPESVWGLPKNGYLKKNSGNYVSLGGGNTRKSQERHSKIPNELKKRRTSPESVKILIKRNDQIIEYQNDLSSNLFNVEKESENFLAMPIFSQVNKRELKKSDGTTRTESLSEENNKNTDRKKYENSSNRDTETTDFSEKKGNFNEVKDQLSVVEEGDEREFAFFVREESKSTEIISPYKANFKPEHKLLNESFEQNLNNEKIDLILNPNKLEGPSFVENPKDVPDPAKQPKDKGKDVSPNTEKLVIDTPTNTKSPAIVTPTNTKSRVIDTPTNTKKPPSTESPAENTEIEQKSNKKITENPLKPEISPKTIHNPLPIPQALPTNFREFNNKVHQVHSESIINKIPLKRRSIHRDLVIQNQDPLKISQIFPEPTNLIPNLSLYHQPGYTIKGFNNREVQTSLHDTPHFPGDYSESNSPEPLGFIEFFSDRMELIQAQVNEKFNLIGDELQALEKRVVSVDDTCKFLKEYRKVRSKYSRRKEDIEENFEDFNEVTFLAPPSPDQLTEKWANILGEVEKGDINKAFEMVLETRDDLYLLRLMFKFNPCLRNLPQKISLTVISKLIGTLQGRFIENLGIEWIVTGLKNPVFEKTVFEVSEEISEAMKNVASKGGEEAEEAQQVFEYLQEALNME